VEPHTAGILGRAELLLRADNKYTQGSPQWPDLSGNNHHAQYGSTSGADTNDPLFLPHTGTQYLYLPGIAANYASTPDAAALDITGDIDLQAKIAMDDWTPAAEQWVLSKYYSTGNQRGYGLSITTIGTLSFRWSTDGTAGNTIQRVSTVAPTVTDGADLWIRGTLDVSSGQVRFYTGGTGAEPSWSALGTLPSAAGATSIFSNTAALEVGSVTGGVLPMAGRVYAARVYSDLTQTTDVFNADFTDTTALTEPFATFVEASSNAATVTINRAASGLVSTVVDRPMFLLGTDDYFEIPDHANLDFANGDDFTAMVAGRRLIAPTASDKLLDKRVGSFDQGYKIDFGTTAGRVDVLVEDTAAASAGDTTANTTAGQAFIVALRRDDSTPELEAFLDGVGTGSPSTTATADLSGNTPLRIGALSAATSNFFDGEIHAVVLWREALSDADVATAGAELVSAGSPLLGAAAERFFGSGWIVDMRRRPRIFA